MPIYEYKCPNCGIIEIIHKIQDFYDTCPVCLEKIEKIFSIPAKAQFKGKGFYETEYKKKGK